MQSESAVSEGESLALDNSAGSGIVWAIYRLGAPEPEHSRLKVDIELGQGQAWLALGDHSRSAWNFEPAADSLRYINIDHSRNVSPEGALLCAVMAAPGSSVLVNGLSLETGGEWQSTVLYTAEAIDRLWLSKVDGRPAALFLDSYAGIAYYAACSTELGLEQGDWQLGEAFDAVQYDMSAALLAGRPAAVYRDSRGLMFASCDKAAPDEGWTSERVVESHLFNACLAEIAGQPAIAMQTNRYQLFYLSRSGAQWVSCPVQTSGLSGFDPQLVSVGGKPAIFHRANGGASLNYCLAASSQPQQEEDWSFTVLSGELETAPGFSVCMMQEGPAAVWFDMQQGTLVYTTCRSGSGVLNSDWSSAELFAQGLPGHSMALALVAGRPALACLSASQLETRYIEQLPAAASAASGWSQPLTIDSDPQAQGPLAIAEIAGCPALLYRDGKSLKYAIRH